MRYFYTVVITVYLCVFTVQRHEVFAQDGASTDTGNILFTRYLTDNVQLNAALRGKLERLFQLTFKDCETLETIERLKPGIILKPSFHDPDNQNEGENVSDFTRSNPAYGQWIDRSIVKGCGRETQLNILAIGYENAHVPELLPVINGQTKLEIIDQDNAESAILKKLSETAGCYDPIFVLGSRFLGYRDADNTKISKSDQKAGWYERWVVEACNAYHEINLAILADGETRFRFIAQIANNKGAS